MPKANLNQSAIKNVKEYAKFTLFLYIVAVVFFVTYYVAIIAFAVSQVHAPMSTTFRGGIISSALVAAGLGAIILALIFILAIVILFIIAIVNIRQAFTTLSQGNGNLYKQPLDFVNLMIIFLVLGIIIGIIGAISLSILTVLFAVFLVAAGSIIGQYGIALGLWRIGSSYNNTILKVGSIMAPFTNIPGMLLVYLGADEIESSAMNKK